MICTKIPFSWGLLTPRRSLFEGLFGCSLWVRRVAEKPVDGVFQTLIILKRDFFTNDPFPVLKGGFYAIIGKHVFSIYGIIRVGLQRCSKIWIQH